MVGLIKYSKLEQGGGVLKYRLQGRRDTCDDG